jgi:hypothetical protein
LAYTFSLFDANGNLIWSAPNIISPSTVSAILTGLTQPVLGAILWPQTPSEQALGLTPANYAYVASPFRDPRRDGVTGTALTTQTDDTITMNASLAFVLSYQGGMQMAESFHIMGTAFAINFSSGGNRQTQAFGLKGVTNVTSTLNQGATNTPGVLLNCAAPGITQPTECNAYFEDFGVIGNASTQIGINFQDMALITTKRLQVSFCGVGIQSLSSLIGRYEDNILESNLIGYNFGTYASSSGANALAIKGGSASGNQVWGINLGGSATDLQLENLLVEGNGTGGAATSGSTTTIVDTTKTWTAGIFVGQLAYVNVGGTWYNSTITANTANTLTFGAIGAAVVGTDSYYIGGGLVIGAGIVGSYGFSTLLIKGCHFEVNQGPSISTAGYPTPLSGLSLSIQDTSIEQAGVGGLCLQVACTFFAAKNVTSPAAGDLWLVNAVNSIIENCTVTGGITDISTYSTWRGVYQFGNLAPLDARPNQFTLTLSAGGGGAGGTVIAKQDGKRVTLITPQIAASATGTTITGSGLASSTIPNVLIPSVSRVVPCLVVVNGNTALGWIVIAATTGAITLFAYGGFTTAQVNGLATGEISYDL